MPIHDHEPSLRGRAFLWGGIGCGLLLLLVLLTRGFGLLSRSGQAVAERQLMIRQGDKILVPEGSAMRGRLSVEAASLQPVNQRLSLPGVVESDPARVAAVLTPLSGRLTALKVALGDRVTKGQVLAVIDSPDLGQAYDDNEKAADSFKLSAKNLERQAAQKLKLGVASDKGTLDQRQERSRPRRPPSTSVPKRVLKMLGVDKKPSIALAHRHVPVRRQRHDPGGGARQHDQ